MTTQHTNICANGCIYAKKVVWLSRAGTSEDWLYRCTKLEERIITTDSVIHELGCATYTTTINKSEEKVESKADLIEKAEGLLKEINLKLEEDTKKKVETPISPVTAPVKPVEKAPEPAIVTSPVVTQQLQPPASPETPKEPPKKRGRKPKQPLAAEPPVVTPPVVAQATTTPVPIKEEVIKDGGSTDGTDH